MENLKDILDKSGIDVREPKRFSITEDSEKLFKEAFLLVDKTVTEDEFQMLDEYLEVIEWLKDSKGKGLFLTGSVGRGKSVIVNGVIPLLFRYFHGKVLHPVPARELHKHELGWAVVIDDVGQDVPINDWGTKIYSVDNAVSHCEDKMKLLIMSSNLNKKQLQEKYGDRIVDRINRLCKLVIFKGGSLRK